MAFFHAPFQLGLLHVDRGLADSKHTLYTSCYSSGSFLAHACTKFNGLTHDTPGRKAMGLSEHHVWHLWQTFKVIIAFKDPG